MSEANENPNPNPDQEPPPMDPPARSAQPAVTLEFFDHFCDRMGEEVGKSITERAAISVQLMLTQRDLELARDTNRKLEEQLALASAQLGATTRTD